MCGKNKEQFNNYYESPDEDKNPFGVLEECYDECSTCSKGEETSSNGKLIINCDTCKTKYHDIIPSTNCLDKCEDSDLK